jgi:glycyl-tRNA synthetase
MSAEEVDLDEMRASVARQGAKVREIKKSGNDGLAEALDMLKKLKLDLVTAAAAQGSDIGQKLKIDRTALDTCMVRRMFVVPSFEIYGGVRGFYTYGPPGCAVKANLISMWRQHFVLEEKMQEIECTNLMPHAVLAASGHVERFCDLMVKDTANGDCYRADKLLEEHIEKLLGDGSGRSSEETLELEHTARQADAYGPSEMDEIFKKLGIVSPLGNPFSEAFPFNLMFKSTIGPEGTMDGYLRPETAQGIFINFNRLLDCNYGKMPFAAAQIGQAYRNEIAPRNGLLRVREFCQAEIEHFVHPEMMDHPKFHTVAGDKLALFPKGNQLGNGRIEKNITLEEAVDKGIVDNQTLAYFMGRCAAFLLKAGIKPQYLRFRQHLDTEMAHYAKDCWDAEILTSFGWTECVGVAYRGCYDIECHMAATNKKMVATYVYPDGPREKTVVNMKIVRKEIGKAFKKQSKPVQEALAALSQDFGKALEFEAKLAADGSASLDTSDGPMTVLRNMVSFTEVTKKVNEEKYTPSVVEPSFGIGRILYALMEQAFDSGVGGDAARTVFRFNPTIAPIKCGVLPLSANKLFSPTVQMLSTALTKLGMENKVDESSTAVGRRYARMDEIGVPFVVTVDFNTIGHKDIKKDDCVTIRERDSTNQTRVPLLKAPGLINALVKGHITFEELCSKYGEAGGSSTAYLCGGGNNNETANVVVESASPAGNRLLFSRPAPLN